MLSSGGVKLLVILGVLGVLGFDGGTIMYSHFQAADRAAKAADVASETFNSTKNVQSAYQAAEAADPQDSIKPTEFLVEPNGAIKLTVHGRSASVLAHRFSFSKGWTVVTEVGTANPPS